MKTLHRLTSLLLASGLALALTEAGAFAASAPAEPDPTSKGTPMEDASVPKTQSTTPYSSGSGTSASTSSDMSAQTPGMQSKFESLDVNHDGYIDKQEAAADPKLAKQFAKLDANKDTKLSITEFSNAKGLALNKNPKSGKSEDSSIKDR